MEHWTLLQQVEPQWFLNRTIREAFEILRDCQRDVREGAEPPADLFQLSDDPAFRECLSRALLLPAERFGGEVSGLDREDPQAFAFQLARMRRRANQRRRQQLVQDMQLILSENPTGGEHLRKIDELSRENLAVYEQLRNTHRPSS